MINKSNIKRADPSTLKDVLCAFIMSVVVAIIYFLVYFYLGCSHKFGENVITIFGAILAIAGFMAQQYQFQETINFLSKWKKINFLLDNILSKNYASLPQSTTALDKLEAVKKRANVYSAYVTRELKLIPMVPVALVALYGMAVIAVESILVQSFCLWLMLFLVLYLTKATISANNLAVDQPDLDEVIHVYQDMLKKIRSSDTANTVE